MIWWTTVLYRFISFNLENLRFGELQWPPNLRLHSTVEGVEAFLLQYLQCYLELLTCTNRTLLWPYILYPYVLVPTIHTTCQTCQDSLSEEWQVSFLDMSGISLVCTMYYWEWTFIFFYIFKFCWPPIPASGRHTCPSGNDAYSLYYKLYFQYLETKIFQPLSGCSIGGISYSLVPIIYHISYIIYQTQGNLKCLF